MRTAAAPVASSSRIPPRCGGEHPGPDPAGRLVQPRPQIVLDVVAVVVGVGGFQVVDRGGEIVDREVRCPIGSRTDRGQVVGIANLHDARGHLQRLDRRPPPVLEPPGRTHRRVSGEGGEFGGGRVDVSVGGAASRVRQGDEYGFAVTQFGGEALSISWVYGGRVDHTERVAESAVLVGEYAQHCHVDGHAPMLRAGHVGEPTNCSGAGQVALRSSAPIASSTATRVSTGPEIVPSLIPARNRLRR